MKAVILAGGIGSRMGDLCKDFPKPMTRLCGKPVLQHQIEALHKEGIDDFIIVVGHLHHIIEDYFSDGAAFGVSITYYREEAPLGTAGALFHLDLKEDFLLCNGDLVFDFCVEDMVRFHKSKNALATLFVHPNTHPFDSVLIKADKSGRVIGLIEKSNKPPRYSNMCNAGVQIISPELLRLCSLNGKADLDKDVIKPGITTERIYAYRSAEYVHDMGTPERLSHTENDIKNGIVASKHKRKKQRAVFVDRDGTLNVHKGFIRKPEEMELLHGAAQAVSELNAMGYPVIVITNQPVIARGECSEDTLREIHDTLETLLGKEGAFVDGIYYCPHHPDKGFEGEVAEMKIHCSCRKPAPGLLISAAADFNIDLGSSYMVGDSLRDVQAGVNAGCVPVYIGAEKEPLPDGTITAESLLEFSQRLAQL